MQCDFVVAKCSSPVQKSKQIKYKTHHIQCNISLLCTHIFMQNWMRGILLKYDGNHQLIQAEMLITVRNNSLMALTNTGLLFVWLVDLFYDCLISFALFVGIFSYDTETQRSLRIIAHRLIGFTKSRRFS